MASFSKCVENVLPRASSRFLQFLRSHSGFINKTAKEALEVLESLEESQRKILARTSAAAEPLSRKEGEHHFAQTLVDLGAFYTRFLEKAEHIEKLSTIKVSVRMEEDIEDELVSLLL